MTSRRRGSGTWSSSTRRGRAPAVRWSTRSLLTGPRTVVYVACDPAAFARDVSRFAEAGYALDSLRAFDLFPMTHHVECVGVLHRLA